MITALSNATYSAPIDTDIITLPVGCQSITITFNLSLLDLASVKTFAMKSYLSIDGGITWSEEGGFTWRGPSLGPLQLSSGCAGLDGALVKATIFPDAGGITTDAVVEVV